MKMRNMKKGITLISLVITIIILLILAGVSIAMLTGENGILNKSKIAKEKDNKETATEIINLKITDCQIKSYGEQEKLPTLAYLAAYLENDKQQTGEIEYVEKVSKKTSSLDETSYADWKELYTKLAAYPYEFKIDSSLRLAEIDGVKVADSEGKEEFVSKEDYNKLLERIQKLEDNQSEPTNNEPTGIKTDTYIENIREVATDYDTVTSMNGFTRKTDDGNKIAAYLSYDSTNGYTVLKSGWYFIDMKVFVYGEAPSVELGFMVDEVMISGTGMQGMLAPDRVDNNGFSIFLKEGQKIYFTSKGKNIATERFTYARCCPMF